MMRFSVRPMPAKENLEMRPGEVDDKAWKDPLSAGAHLQIGGDVLIGICDSLSQALVKRGLEKEAINNTMLELINLFVQNGDADTRIKEWITERDFSNFDYDVRSSFSKVDQSDRWDSWYIIRRAGRSGIESATQWNDECFAKMNDREKELVQKLHETRRAYWQAQEAYEDYVEDHSIMTINDFFIKYADQLSKIDKDWYDYVEEHLKACVQSVLKRRAEKKAEDTATAERPTAAV